jgi:hypothetical protein
MIEFVFAQNNWMYSAALGVVLALFIIELLGMLLGVSLFNFVDDFTPVNFDADADASVGISPALSWLSLDRLPLMVWFLLFLTLFGIFGFVLNLLALKLSGATFDGFVSVPLSLALGLIMTGRIGGILARLLPKNESSAANESDFEGLVARITLGTAKPNSPAEAKCIDHFNQAHYVMVEPIENTESFTQNEKVILIKKGENAWLATRFV